MILMQQSSPRPRRLRAAFIGFGLDNGDDEQRLTRGDQTLIFGGSAETHAELRETALKMEQELNRRGPGSGRARPDRAGRAWPRRSTLRNCTKSPCDSRKDLERQGRAFEDLTAEELTALSASSKDL